MENKISYKTIRNNRTLKDVLPEETVRELSGLAPPAPPDPIPKVHPLGPKEPFIFPDPPS